METAGKKGWTQQRVGRYSKGEFNTTGRGFPSLESPAQLLVEPEYVVRFRGKEWGLNQPRHVGLTNRYLAELLLREIDPATGPRRQEASLITSAHERVELVSPSSGVFIRFTIGELIDGNEDFFNIE